MFTRVVVASVIAAGLTAGVAGISAASPQYAGYKTRAECEAGITKYGAELGYAAPFCVQYKEKSKDGSVVLRYQIATA